MSGTGTDLICSAQIDSSSSCSSLDNPNHKDGVCHYIQPLRVTTYSIAWGDAAFLGNLHHLLLSSNHSHSPRGVAVRAS